jgi:hypothetical protein
MGDGRIRQNIDMQIMQGRDDAMNWRFTAEKRGA